MRTIFITKIFIGFLFISSTLSAATLITSNTGAVDFEAVGKPSMVKIKGHGEGATSNLILDANKLNGTVSFKLDSLKTGIDMRDAHMKEKYLNTKKNPEAVVSFENLVLPATWSLQKPATTETAFSGKLKLNGIEKPVTGIFSIEDTKLKTTAAFEIKLSDFNIDIPVYLGVKVADIVKVKVAFDKMNSVVAK